MNEITRPAPLDEVKSKRFFRFDATVSMGTLLQMGLIALGAIMGYGEYTRDKAQSRMELEQVKIDLIAQRGMSKESLNEIRADVKEVQKTLVEVNQSMAVLKARSEPQRQR